MRLTNSFILTTLIALMLFVISAPAAEETPADSQVAGKPADAKYPFVAQVTGNEVYVRSGNSQNDYPCTKLSSPSMVTVVDEVFGWAKILPPEGTYSWIYKAYVDVDESNPTVGVVTGENVNVWAGSDTVDSGNSIGLQTKLNAGEIVELFENQPDTGDYYRIKPPTGAHLWIHTDYLKYIGPVQQDKPIVVPPRPQTTDTSAAGTQENVPTPSENEQGRPQFTNINDQQQQAQPTESIQIQQQEQPSEQAQDSETQAAAPNLTQKESQLLKQCYDLAAKVDEQLKKPLAEQDYSEIKKQLQPIQNDPDAGKAGAYAGLLSNRIQRYELAQSVTETLKQQEQQLERKRKQIEQAHQEQLNQMPKEVQYLYTGTLKPSHVYTAKSGLKRYLLVDDRGKIECYLTAAGPAMEAQLEANVSKSIGINGNIVSDEKSLVTLVAITEMKVFEE